MLSCCSLRLAPAIVVITACKGWQPHQLDVKTAFLYSILKEEIYMHLPEGSRMDGKVAKLQLCIYGLKYHQENGIIDWLNT
jgi:hypothetical protein